MSSFCSSLSRVPALLRRHETCLIRHRLYPSLPLCHGWHVRLGHLKFRCHHLNLRIGCAVGKPPGVRSQQIVIMKLALSLLAAPAIAFTAPQTTPTRAATQLFAYVPGVLRGAISLRVAAISLCPVPLTVRATLALSPPSKSSSLGPSVPMSTF